MSELEGSSVPPFDQLPDADVADGLVDERRSMMVKVGLVVLFLACVGIGQGIAVTWLFGRDKDHLSANVESQEDGATAPPTHEETPPDHEEPTVAEPSTSGPTTDSKAAKKAKEKLPSIVPPLDIEVSEDDSLRRDPHVLEMARERFVVGDVEGARRIVAAYLLRVDGMTHADALRAPEAYAVLADVLRRDFERSLGRNDY